MMKKTVDQNHLVKRILPVKFWRTEVVPRRSTETQRMEAKRRTKSQILLYGKKAH